MKLTTLLKWGAVILMAMAFTAGWVTTRAVGVQASTWHVATDGSDITGDGSEANPFATIQHGIDVAGDGDTVLVHPGVYEENINFVGKNITVGSLLVTTGDEDYILQTVIDGNRNGHVVTFANGEDATARLSGFTITNGYASDTSAPGNRGGGVFCLDSSPTLTHLKVSGNEAVNEGGGLYFDRSSPIMQDVIVANNLAGTGAGGILYANASVSLENVIVAHNSARGGSGAGILFYHAEGTVTNALIADNSGVAKGGGLMFDGCSPTLINVTVVGNWTAGHGGGLNISYMSQPTLVNSIVWGNSPEQIYFDTDWGGEAVTVEYSDIQGGEAGIVTNGQGPVYWGDGNIDASPRFVNVGLGNYHLADNSPCINAGKTEGAPVTDIEGNPRPDPPGSNPDMGAYENPLGLGFRVYLPVIFQNAWQWEPAGSMTTARVAHTATLLRDGRVLLVGGYTTQDPSTASAEIYDPATGIFSPTASLNTGRHEHSATLLPDGRVLVVGGYNSGYLRSAEIYDPATCQWTPSQPLFNHGILNATAVLTDGRVLVTGGNSTNAPSTDVEIFDPTTDTWHAAAPLSIGRNGHAAILLNDGWVLVLGGNGDVAVLVAEIYDPATDAWTPTGPMNAKSARFVSALLPDGRVLAAGGINPTSRELYTTAEIYDPATGEWTLTAPLVPARCGHAGVVLPDGRVLVTGGGQQQCDSGTDPLSLTDVQIYDYASAAWSALPPLHLSRAKHTATLLPDGRILVAGGYAAADVYLDSAEILTLARR